MQQAVRQHKGARPAGHVAGDQQKRRAHRLHLRHADDGQGDAAAALLPVSILVCRARRLGRPLSRPRRPAADRRAEEAAKVAGGQVNNWKCNSVVIIITH